jgi:hypothetical protein
MKFSGFVNDTAVNFGSLKELKKYSYKSSDKILIMGGTKHSRDHPFFSKISQIKEYVAPAFDRYGYSRNKSMKGEFGYYKDYKR